MKIHLGGLAAAVAVFALLLVPVASASGTAAAQFRLVPLPASSIGASAQGLALAPSPNSGVISNTLAAMETTDATASTFTKLGRVTGYALDYGYPTSGAAGITDVTTGVEQYKTTGDAPHGLAFWKKEFSGEGSLNAGGFSASTTSFAAPKVGVQRFAFLSSFSASDIAPLATVDEYFVRNRYVASVEVSAGTISAAKSLAATLAAKLDARLKLALKGHLKGTGVKLPPPQTAGPPAGGPNLSALALTTTDLAADTPTLIGHQYFVDPTAISDYSVGMNLGFQGITQGILDQEVEWYPTANAAAFYADLANAVALAQDPAHTTVVDLSSLGHGARGSVTQGTGSSPIGTGTVVFASGQFAEFIFIAVNGGIGTVDPLTNVATAAANHITSVLGP
jgi:hypothetical protein